MTVKNRLDRLSVKYGLGFQESELSMYGFGTTRSFDEAAYFLSQEQLVNTVRPLLNTSNQRHILEDKWVAAHYTAGIGLPSPRTICLWQHDSGLTFTGHMMRGSSDLEAILGDSGCSEIIIKPRGGRQARALLLAKLDRSAPALKLNINDVDLTVSEFIERLKEEDFGDYGGGYDGWLIQERLEQHARINSINPDTLNTVRLVTVKTRDAGTQFVGAAMRIGRSGAVVDSWAFGGLSVGIDLQTGILGKGVFKLKHGGHWTSTHPDSGVIIEGMEVPHWQQCIDVARKAAAAYSGVGTVGWDIAVTPYGAVLVEGNADWSLSLVQIHTDGLLKGALGVEIESQGTKLPNHLPRIFNILVKKLKRKARRILQRPLAAA